MVTARLMHRFAVSPSLKYWCDGLSLIYCFLVTWNLPVVISGMGLLCQGLLNCYTLLFYLSGVMHCLNAAQYVYSNTIVTVSSAVYLAQLIVMYIKLSSKDSTVWKIAAAVHYSDGILIVAWSKTIVSLHVVWQPLSTTVLIGVSQRHRELNPPRYIEVGLGNNSCLDQVFYVPSRQSSVIMHHFQGWQHPAVQCGQRQTGVANSDSHR